MVGVNPYELNPIFILDARDCFIQNNYLYDANTSYFRWMSRIGFIHFNNGLYTGNTARCDSNNGNYGTLNPATLDPTVYLRYYPVYGISDLFINTINAPFSLYWRGCLPFLGSQDYSIPYYYGTSRPTIAAFGRFLYNNPSLYFYARSAGFAAAYDSAVGGTIDFEVIDSANGGLSIHTAYSVIFTVSGSDVTIKRNTSSIVSGTLTSSRPTVNRMYLGRCEVDGTVLTNPPTPENNYGGAIYTDYLSLYNRVLTQQEQEDLMTWSTASYDSEVEPFNIRTRPQLYRTIYKKNRFNSGFNM